MRMTSIALAFATLALPAAVTPVDAQQSPRPWCLQGGRGAPGGGLPDCSYQTLEQCRAALGGGSDHCFANPALGWDRLEGKGPRPPQGRPRG